MAGFEGLFVTHEFQLVVDAQVHGETGNLSSWKLSASGQNFLRRQAPETTKKSEIAATGR